MPRKPKFTREEVLTSAFEIARNAGIQAVTAAAVAENMGYTGSSLFTHFDSMDALKQAVYDMAVRYADEYLSECLNYTPAFKEFGMRWVRFARKEPNLYTLLFVRNVFEKGNPVQEFSHLFRVLQAEVQKNFGLSEAAAAELIDGCMTYANGIAHFVINGNAGDYSEESVGRGLSNICLGMVLLFKTREGGILPEQATLWSRAIDKMPVHR